MSEVTRDEFEALRAELMDLRRLVHVELAGLSTRYDELARELHVITGGMARLMGKATEQSLSIDRIEMGISKLLQQGPK